MVALPVADDHLAAMKNVLLEERQALLSEAANLARRERDFSVAQKMDDGGGAGGDAADVATEMFEQELALGLAQHLRTHLMEINDALIRIDEGAYGLCEDCEEPINVERLRALPRAKRCVPCQQARETAARTGRLPISFSAAAKRRQQAAAKPVAARRRVA
jgi:DnaK suppressor protein